MKAIRLRTEYLTDPIGIDITAPRLFWNCEGGIQQVAYQIVARRAGEPVWDTGRTESSQMAGIPWGGPMLGSRDSVDWQVRLWDENNEVGDWSTARFELGLLDAADWRAKWITGAYKPQKRRRCPVDCFRKTFTCGAADRARLYITACGLYEARINGARVGGFVMAPGYTDYRRRVQYQTYDIAPLLREGENEITVQLADGWYRGSIGAMGVQGFFGRQTKLLAQLEIGDDIIATDESWSWSNDGPLAFADMKDGEVADLRKTPSYSGRAMVTEHPVQPCASNNVPVTEHERFTPVVSAMGDGRTLLDFGQNIAGYVELRLSARAGQTVSMQFAEHLDENGTLDMAAIQCRAGKPNATPRQEIHLTCREGENHYKTAFAVFGFRYAMVETNIPLLAEDITAIAVYSDMERVGWFECSNPLLTRFVENTLWSMKGNFLDVPTDCPTRERAGWTGDAQIFCETGSYLMDTLPFFRKWLRDLADRQTEKGKVHCIVPTVGNEGYISRMDGCCGWADAAVLVPWRLAGLYGDDALLRACYPSMRAHTLFEIGRTNGTGLFGKPFKKPDKKYISNIGQAFGEWLEPRDVYQQSIIKDFCAPHPEEATAYLTHICGIMAQLAGRLGHDADRAVFEEYRDGCKKAYANQFTPVETDRQSKLVRPLAFGLLDGAARQAAFARLLQAIEKRQYRIGTGFLSTPLILPLLTEMGRLDAAYRMMENEAEPGWLYQVKSGATTVWENWDGSASQNHYANGSVCQWLFQTVCGIRVAGENRFSIAPQPGGTLNSASFAYTSVYGRVACRWEKTGGETRYTVEVPAGTTAEVRLPGGGKAEKGPGTHVLHTDEG